MRPIKYLSTIIGLFFLFPAFAFAYGTCPGATTAESLMSSNPSIPIFTVSPVGVYSLYITDTGSASPYGYICDLTHPIGALNSGNFGSYNPLLTLDSQSNFFSTAYTNGGNGSGAGDTMVYINSTSPFGGAGSDNGYAFFTVGSGNLVGAYSTPPGDTTTRIDSVVPVPDSSANATSTSFTFSASGYVNGNDYATSSTMLHIRARQLTGMGLRDNSILSQGVEFYIPITASGAFSVSTTTNIYSSGQWTAYYAIETPSITVFGVPILFEDFWLPGGNFFTKSLAVIYDKFEVATSSSFEQQEAAIDISGNSIVASTTVSGANNCAALSAGFDLGACLTSLVQPSDAELADDVNTVKTKILAKAPWGYVYRFVSILSASSTVALPTFNVDIADNTAASGTLAFDPGDMLSGGGTLLSGITDPHSGKNMRQIIEPFIQLFIAISVLIIIFHDLMAMGHHQKHK